MLLLGCCHSLADLALGLIADYPLDGSGKDASGNGHDGVVENPTPTANRFGQDQKALLFDGTNCFVAVPDAPDLRLAAGDLLEGRTPVPVQGELGRELAAGPQPQ
jgi:hypothetical protein